MSFDLRHLLGIEQLAPSDIELLLDTAATFKEINERPIKKVPTLRGKTILCVFFEASTRTRISFELAGKRLSADTVNMGSAGSSTSKGETLLDTARTLDSMAADVIVMRHRASGAPHLVAKHVRAAVVNAGDGLHEHPSQALLDALTIRQSMGRIEGLTVAIVGDIANSRVARSDALCLTKLGAKVRFVGPPTLIPRAAEAAFGVEVRHRLEHGIEGADVVMMLRVQLERGGGASFPDLREYSQLYGLDNERLKLAAEGAIVMHPGPLNRGVEIAPEVADGPHQVILDQVANGVAVRMAILYHLAGGSAEGSTVAAARDQVG